MTHLRFAIAPLALVLAASSLLLAGCGGGKSVAQPKPLTDLPASPYHMQVVWHRNGGNGGGPYDSGFRPAVADGVVYTANRDGEVAAFDLSSGHRLWHVHTDATLVSGPGKVGDMLLMGTRNGGVVAVAAADGASQWTADLSSEVIAAPSGGSGVAVARTVDGHVAAMDLASGDRLWTIDNTVPNLTLRGTASPVVDGQTVYIGTDGGKVQALDLATGQERWNQTVALPDGRSELDRIVDVDGDPLLEGDTLYAASAGNAIVAMSRGDGSIRWKHAIASDENMAVDRQDLFAAGTDSIVWSVDKSTGEPSWKNDALEYRQLSAPAVLDGNVLVGDYEGYLHWLAGDDGHEIARGHPFGSAIRAQPVRVGNDEAIVLSADGELALVRFVRRGG